LLAGGSGQINNLADAAKKLGIVLSDEQIQKADQTADKMSAMKQVLEAKIAGIVADNSTAILGMAESLAKLTVSLANSLAKIGAWSAKLDSSGQSIDDWINATDAKIASAFTGLVSTVTATLSGLVAAVRTWVVDKLGAVWDSAIAKIDRVKNAFRVMYDVVVGHSYVPDMIDGIAQSMAQLQQIMVDPALNATQKVGAAFQSLAGLIGGLFGQKAGSIIGALGQFASAIGPLFGGKGFDAAGFAATEASNFKAMGMSRGGSGVFGGRSGIDRNVLSLNGSPIARVSKGERFSVGANAAPMAKVMIVPTPYFDAVVDQRAVTVAAPMAGQAAVMGAAGGVAGMNRRHARTLP
jgi:hypothetical protein